MLRRQTSGSVVCPSCGKLVGVKDERCWSCGRRNPGLWGYAPVLRRLGQDLGFVPLVIGGAVILYLAALAADPDGVGMQGLSLLAPSGESLFLLGASGAVPVFGFGRWWTVLSAGWLHGGLLHILFNVLWLRQLAPATAEIFGPARMVVLYTASSVAGFLASSMIGALGVLPPPFGGARVTVGASAAIFGLLGALVSYGRTRGASAVGQQAWTWAVILFVFGFLWPGIDNWAHLGGFAGGFLGARLLDPDRPERLSHQLAALACLAASAGAILASVVTGWAMVR
jgi:rhomboid protease GluP